MSTDRHKSPEQVRELDRCERLKPKESDLAGRKGYERYHVVKVGGERIKVQGEAPDGTYRWRYAFKPNDHGKPTREFSEVAEMLKPFQRADTKRAMSMPSNPALTDDAVHQRGWSHTRCGAGSRVERGIDGELWRATPDGLSEPTGRWCLGEPQPWATVPEDGNADGSMK